MLASRKTPYLIAALVLLLAPPLRATADGALDPGFGSSGETVFAFPAGDQVDVHAIRTAPAGGGLTVAAGFHQDGFGSRDFLSCSLSQDGGSTSCFQQVIALDDPHGNAAMAVAYQLDGKRVLAGYASGTAADPERRLAFAGLDVIDTLDGSFGNAGIKTINFGGAAEAVAISARRNGDLLFTGNYDHETSTPGTGVDCVVGRMLADGTLDDTYSDNGLATIGWDLGADDSDECVGEALYRSGRLVVAASVQRADNTHEIGIAMLRSNGTLDTDFSGNGKRLVPIDLVAQGDADAGAVALDHLGRIVVGGRAWAGTGWRATVVRLWPDGSLDTSLGGTGKVTFNVSGTSDDVLVVTGLRILPPPGDDIVVSGEFDDNDHDEGFVAVLHDNGNLDGSFGTGGRQTLDLGADHDNRVAALTLQGGKIVVASDFPTRINGPSDVGTYAVFRLYMKRIAGDDFEGGNLALWSNFADP